MKFAVPFDYSMHNYLLRYYVAEHGLDPDQDIQIRAVPPPEMVANLRADNIDGFLAPDPVNQRAVYDGVGFIHVLSKEIWDRHPCCAFAASREFVTGSPNTYAALLKAIIDATAFATKAENRKQIAEAIAPANYLNQPVTVVEQVLTGTFADGLGNVKKVPDRIDFDPFPYESFAVWILTQMKRWGQIKGDIDYAAVAKQVFLATDTTKLMQEVGLTPPAATSKNFRRHGQDLRSRKAGGLREEFCDQAVVVARCCRAFARHALLSPIPPPEGRSGPAATGYASRLVAEAEPGRGGAQIRPHPSARCARTTLPLRGRDRHRPMTRSLSFRAGLVSVLIFLAFVLVWHLATRGTGAVQQMDPEYAKLMGLTATQGKSAMPGPLEVGAKLWEHVRRPFYDNGPNDKGVGIQLAYSIARVGAGYLLAVLVAIPIGFLIGMSPLFSKALDPFIQVLKPISPLAWMPLALYTIKDSGLSAIFVIFICSLWPMLINTAFGVAAVRKEWLNVARTLEVGTLRRAFTIILPAAAPTILTGMRISIGIAWLVIVAAEMLVGGTGIGYFVWNEWNNLSITNVINAILLIGLVGMVLDQVLARLTRLVTFPE